MSSHLSAKDYPGSAEIVAREQAMTSATAAAPRQSQIAFIFFKQMTHSAIPWECVDGSASILFMAKRSGSK
jgi:hypothetical protein